jgi:hypothetical protein
MQDIPTGLLVISINEASICGIIVNHNGSPEGLHDTAVDLLEWCAGLQACFVMHDL